MVEHDIKPNWLIIKRMPLCKCFLLTQNKCNAVMLKQGIQINFIKKF